MYKSTQERTNYNINKIKSRNHTVSVTNGKIEIHSLTLNTLINMFGNTIYFIKDGDGTNVLIQCVINLLDLMLDKKYSSNDYTNDTTSIELKKFNSFMIYFNDLVLEYQNNEILPHVKDYIHELKRLLEVIFEGYIGGGIVMLDGGK